MSAAMNGGFSRRIAGVLTGVWMIGGIACATVSKAPAPDANVAVLSDVHVEQRGEMTVVTLEGVGNPLYTALDDSDGQQLVVDLNAVRPEGVPEEIALVAGLVDEVAVSAMVDAAGDPFTRVALSLDSEVHYQVIPEGAGLAIHVTPALEDLAMDEPASFDEAPAVAMEDVEEVFTSEASEPEVEIAVVPVVLANALMGVEDTGEAILVRADGRVEGSTSFALEDPSRLVIDVKGLENHIQSGRVAVNGESVAGVRIGQHPDKIRIVLDAAEGASLSDWQVAATPEGLVAGPADVTEAMATLPAVAELDHPVVAEASPLAGEAEADPMGEPQAMIGADTSVDEVAFHAGAGSARVVIVAEGPASYQLFEPDAETVVVSFPEAALRPGAEARIAPDPGGPVSLVMAFQQPDMEHPEVRVVITRGSELQPMITREGSNIVVAFDETAGAANMPPAVADHQTGSNASGKAMAMATSPASPAAQGEGDGLEILREGGLLDGKQYVGRRISLDFKDVAIDDVLRLIAEVSDLNIIAGDDVTGKVTIRLVDVPWDQALDVILLTKGLGFVKVGNVLRIAPQTMLKSEGEARLQERRAKEKLEDLVVKFQPVNYAAVGNVAKLVQRLLSARGTVNTDSRTNTVIIKDIPTVIDESVALIKAIDTPTPQVLIEAKIVEANLDFSRELGMVWGGGVQSLEDGFNSSSAQRQNAGNPDFRLRPDPVLLEGAGDLNNFVIDNPITSLPTALVNLGAFLLDEQYNLEVQLQAAESTGEGKVVSSPRVVTLDNREATIQQGTAIPFQTFENGDAQLQFVDAVLQLKVKPHITADKSIIMSLEVSRNAPDDSVAAPGGAPAIAKNEAKTETLVRDGQTLVIGGIYTIQKSDRQSRVPYLHSIPVLGNLFKNKLLRDLRKELLIFVTPRIVDMPELGS